MEFFQIALDLPEKFAGPFTDMAMEMGAMSASIEDADLGKDCEKPIYGEPGEGLGKYWPHCRVRCLFSDKAAGRGVVDEALRQLGVGSARTFESDVPERDWVRLNREQFQPIKVADGFWIVPSWLDNPQPGAATLTLDPGLAFGTGSHPTTMLCLRWLNETVSRGSGQSVLDYGCGSGVLAIAAMLLGAKCADGVDVDPQAIEASEANAKANGVSVGLYLADEFKTDRKPYDLVAANILANPLRALGPLLAAHVAPGGRIALSGVLERQSEEMAGIYSQWFEDVECRFLDDWALITGKKKA